MARRSHTEAGEPLRRSVDRDVSIYGGRSAVLHFSSGEHFVDDRLLPPGPPHNLFGSEFSEDGENEFCPSVASVAVLAAVVVGVGDHPGSSFVEFVSFFADEVGEDGCAFDGSASE